MATTYDPTSDAATYCRHNGHYCPGCHCECHATPTPGAPLAAPAVNTTTHPGRLYYCQRPGHWGGSVFYVPDGGAVQCPGCGAGQCAHERHPNTYGACTDSAQLWANLENVTPDRLISRGACRLMPESAPIPGWTIATDADGEQHAAPDASPDAPCPDCGAHPPHNQPESEIDCDCGVTGCLCDPQTPAVPCGCTFEGASDPVPGRVVNWCPVGYRLSYAGATPRDFDYHAYAAHLDAARAYNPEDGAPCAQCGHGQELHVNGTEDCWWSADATPATFCPCPQYQSRETAQRADEAWALQEERNAERAREADDTCHCEQCAPGFSVHREAERLRLDRALQARLGQPGSTTYACGHVALNTRGYTSTSALPCFTCYMGMPS